MHHLHIRKRNKKSLEPYPATTTWKRFLDSVVYIAGIIGPLMTLPQIILIYGSHDASGISIVSWLGFALLDVPWIVYGLAHREFPIVVTYSFWVTANLAVALGAILYG